MTPGERGADGMSDQEQSAAEDALDGIALACGVPSWDYPGQVLRDVLLLKSRALKAEERVKELEFERDNYHAFLKAEHPDRWWGFLTLREHPADECPSWYDGCNCTVENMMHNIHRAEAAEERVRHLTEALRDVVYIVTGSRMGSIGSINNVYLPQISVERAERWTAALSTPEDRASQPACMDCRTYGCPDDVPDERLRRVKRHCDCHGRLADRASQPDKEAK